MILGGRGERDITRSVNTYTRSSAPHPRMNAHVGAHRIRRGPSGTERPKYCEEAGRYEATIARPAGLCHRRCQQGATPRCTCAHHGRCVEPRQVLRESGDPGSSERGIRRSQFRFLPGTRGTLSTYLYCEPITQDRRCSPVSVLASVQHGIPSDWIQMLGYTPMLTAVRINPSLIRKRPSNSVIERPKMVGVATTKSAVNLRRCGSILTIASSNPNQLPAI